MIGYVKRGVIYDRALPPEAAAKKRGRVGEGRESYCTANAKGKSFFTVSDPLGNGE